MFVRLDVIKVHLIGYKHILISKNAASEVNKLLCAKNSKPATYHGLSAGVVGQDERLVNKNMKKLMLKKLGVSLGVSIGALSLMFVEEVAYPKANEIILIASPKILAIPVKENKEPMVDLRQQKDIVFGPSPEIPNNQDYTKMRASVYQKLKKAQDLLPKGYHFCLYEGYRSLSLQKMLFDNRFEIVKKEQPKWSFNELFDETTKLVSPVVNQDGSKNIPPHSTGGAIDVYLISDDGKVLDMGIHPKDWMTDVKGFLSLTTSTQISPEAQKNRKIMSQVLSAVGLVNYPTEYWHWSYGDRYWAFYKGQDHAIYDTV